MTLMSTIKSRAVESRAIPYVNLYKIHLGQISAKSCILPARVNSDLSIILSRAFDSIECKIKPVHSHGKYAGVKVLPLFSSNGQDLLKRTSLP